MDQGPKEIRIPQAGLSVERLIEEAEIAAALHDFGSNDFRDGLHALLSSVASDARLSRSGKGLFPGLCLRLLNNRLQIEAAFRTFPELAQTEIARPLFIVGLFRSGTSFLHQMLSCDPRGRAPAMWELLAPAPPPALCDVTTKMRIKAAEIDIYNHLLCVPELRRIHPLSATTPEECSLLLQNSFTSIFFFAQINVASYRDWLLEQDMHGAYDYYFRQLQILAWRFPAQHLVLKAPEHLLFLDALLAAFPDASIVHLHRNLRDAVASTCSLVASLRSRWVEQTDRAEIGVHVIDLLRAMAGRSMKVGATVDAKRVYYISYDCLIRQPLAAVQAIYDYFGYAYTPEFDGHLRKYIATNHDGRTGHHRYTLEQYGLTPECVEPFAEYSLMCNQRGTR